MNVTVDLFAGAGGWDVAARELGVDPLGIELDESACATRDAAGLRSLRADVSALDPADFAPLTGLIGSPPCPTFSGAGRGGEQCKDGSPMGVGVPEYVLLLRKPPTDRSRGYADEPVTKSKDGYSLARWQVDAHGFWRSDGNRHLLPDEFAGLTHAEIFRLFRKHNLENVYSYDAHLADGEWLKDKEKLPVDFMLLQPPSWHPDVWTDVARMRTLNMIQARKGKEQHLCPMQFDIADRLIERWSNPGDVVYDPFAGIMTVPYCAVKLDRVGVGVELSPVYWRDGVAHVESVARDHATPSLFDLEESEGAHER